MEITFSGNLTEVQKEMMTFLHEINKQTLEETAPKQPADLTDAEQAEQAEQVENKPVDPKPAETKAEEKPKKETQATTSVDKKDVIEISKKALTVKGGREKVLEIYKSHGEGGSGKLSDVPKENYGKVIQELEAVVNG